MQRIVARVVIGLATTAIAMFGADIMLGTWKFNAAMSKSTSSNPIKSRTEVWESTPDGGVKVTRAEQWADGSTINASYAFKYDGKEYPVTGAPWDTIAVTRLDTHTTRFEIKKTGGKLHITGRNSISKDGKTKTLNSNGTDAQGRAVHSTTVFDRQ